MATVETTHEELSPIKRALLELREMRTRFDDLQGRQYEPVAIIGAGVRFPGGANDLESFWQVERVFEPRMPASRREALLDGWRSALRRALYPA